MEQSVLELAAQHPTIALLEHGEAVSDEQLLILERTLRQELGAGELELSEENIRKAYAVRVGSLLEFLRYLLDIPNIPDYREIVQRQFAAFNQEHYFNADQIRFLRVVQSVFLQKRRLTLPDLFTEPLTAFGADAAARWFSEQEIQEMVEFANQLVV